MRNGEEFVAFYQGERDSLYRAVALTLHDPDLAREAVDEAFVRAAERWPRVRQFERPSAWVYRVAVNWATSMLRKMSLRPTRPAYALDRPYHDDLPDVDLINTMAELSKDHREALVLRFVLGLSVDETAAHLGVAAGTVKSRVRRARMALGAGRDSVDEYS